MILLCHNTLAKSYDSKVGLIIQKRCILVTVFAALLLPILLYACYILCCSLVTNIAVLLVTGYTPEVIDPVGVIERHAPPVRLWRKAPQEQDACALRQEWLEWMLFDVHHRRKDSTFKMRMKLKILGIYD